MFVLSKIVGMLAQPLNLVMVVLLAAVALLFTRWHRFGRSVLAGLCAALVVVAVLPWEDYFIAPLEQRFPAQPLPARIDGVIVLGGAIDPVMSVIRGQPSLNSAADRVAAMADLARRFPSARMVYSGGSGSVTAQEYKEAPVAKALLESWGMDTGRVVFEGQSRNTRENATLSKELMNPQPGEVWLLVTSAWHMPRSVGAFRAADWSVVPYPVDFSTTGRPGSLRFNVGAGLGILSAALHEWMGLAYYRWRGWTDSLYPSP